MAMSQAANLVEKALGHASGGVTAQDVTNPARDRAKYADPSGETMKALCWMGKNKVQVREWLTHIPLSVSSKSGGSSNGHAVDVPKPGLIEDRDVILKVTGSTVCGSDLHLLHGLWLSFAERCGCRQS